MKRKLYEWKDITPTEEEFVLKGKTYKLRPATMRDSIYFESKYGLMTFYKMFAEKPASIMTEIAYRLMDDDNKKQFPTYEIFLDSFTTADINNSKMLECAMKAVGHLLVEKEVDEPNGTTFQDENNKSVKSKGVIRQILSLFKRRS